jgi:uncharacterized protein YdeI (YjbR/CyaY-like superfamily)
MQNNKKWESELSVLASILSRVPLEKSIKWGAEVFTWEGKNVVSYGGFKDYFAVWFYNGVFLRDTYKVLINAQEGKTKCLRQWRFTSVKEIDEKKILEYVNEAIEIEKMGLKMPPDKFAPVTPPQWLAGVLKNDKAFKSAFERLTPGRQKEYIIYLNEAKQEATKLKRLDKIKPMILNGIGLNDKYR